MHEHSDEMETLILSRYFYSCRIVRAKSPIINSRLFGNFLSYTTSRSKWRMWAFEMEKYRDKFVREFGAEPK